MRFTWLFCRDDCRKNDGLHDFLPRLSVAGVASAMPSIVRRSTRGCAACFVTTVRAVTQLFGFINLAKWLRGLNVNRSRRRKH
jgi:hypothetical protein